MKYFFKYKYLNGGKFRGHNLEEIRINENNILLIGKDKLELNDGIYEVPFNIYIDANEIEYLKIEPMKEVEE